MQWRARMAPCLSKLQGERQAVSSPGEYRQAEAVTPLLRSAMYEPAALVISANAVRVEPTSLGLNIATFPD